MDDSQLKDYINQMSQTIRQAGVVALNFQGKVENIGKEIEIIENDTAQIQADRAAKTIIDVTVQDMLLLKMKDIHGTDKIMIDAEEESTFINLFTNKESDLSLVIDPIDGTNIYLHDGDGYSICVGLIQSGEVISALLFFPKRDEFYFIDENKKAYLAKDSFINGLTKKELLQIGLTDSTIVAVNNRVDKLIIEKLKSKGYEVLVIDEMSVALLKCISGEYKAYIEASPQIRDVLLGAIIENMEDGHTLDWSGNKLNWPQKGRIPQVLFGNGDLQDIVKIINS